MKKIRIPKQKSFTLLAGGSGTKLRFGKGLGVKSPKIMVKK